MTGAESAEVRPEFGQSLANAHPIAETVYDVECLGLPVEVDGQIELALPPETVYQATNTRPIYFQKPIGFPGNRLAVNALRGRRRQTFL